MTTDELILAITESMLRIATVQEAENNELAEQMLTRCQLQWNKARPRTLHTEN